MAAPKVNESLLGGLEEMGFPRARATRALHYSGNTSLEDAINWIVDHEDDPEIDQIPRLEVNIGIESGEPFDMTEEIKRKAHELRNRARKRNEEEEQRIEREKEKKRIRTGKELTEAKRIMEENERKRYLALRQTEKEEEKKARENIRRKLEQDKLERRGGKVAMTSIYNPSSSKQSVTIAPDKQNSKLVKSATKAELLRECLRSLKRSQRNDEARVKKSFQTLLIYIGNVARNPDEEKFRKIKMSNPLFQERVASLDGGLEFLELCGFERREGGDFLYLPREKADMAALNAAGSALKSAIVNPFFGVLSEPQ